MAAGACLVRAYQVRRLAVVACTSRRQKAQNSRLSAGTNIGRIGKNRGAGRACATAALPGPDQTGGAGRGACSDTAQASRRNTAGGKP